MSQGAGKASRPSDPELAMQQAFFAQQRRAAATSAQPGRHPPPARTKEEEKHARAMSLAKEEAKKAAEVKADEAKRPAAQAKKAATKAADRQIPNLTTSAGPATKKPPKPSKYQELADIFGASSASGRSAC